MSSLNLVTYALACLSGVLGLAVVYVEHRMRRIDKGVAAFHASVNGRLMQSLETIAAQKALCERYDQQIDLLIALCLDLGASPESLQRYVELRGVPALERLGKRARKADRA